jgi:hypothetical protein
MEYIKVENDIWKLADGSLYEGDVSGVKKAASKVQEAPKKKSTKKSIENKAVKPEDVEDK